VRTLALYVVSVAAAFALSAAVVAWTGHSAWDAIVALYDGSLRGGSSVGQTLDEATPLLLVALGSVVCARAGIFNIGQEGQLAVGAIVATAVALFVPGPGRLVLALALVGSAAGGALWASIAALLHYWRKVDVVVGSLLLVFVGQQVLSFVVNRSYLLGEKARPGAVASPESDMLAQRTWLPRVVTYPHLDFGAGLFVALAFTVAVAVLVFFTRWGFRLRMLGLNPVAARWAGVRVVATGTLALLCSGAFAGLAGGTILTGSAYRLQEGISQNVGFDGLLVALVARNNPLVAVPVALFFGALRAGGGFLASTGVPRYIVDVVTALLVLASVFPSAYAQLAAFRRRPARGTPTGGPASEPAS
jgi:simple sugar transport system permease protein